MKRMRRVPLAKLGVVIALVAVAACGGSAESGSGVGGDGAEADGEPDREAWLVTVGADAPQHLDPVRSIVTCEVPQLQPIYDTLVRVDPDGTLVPGLAREWSAPDELTFDIVLNEGIEFQDGTPFDAEAVRAHLVRAVDDPESVLAPELAAIESVEAVDDLTVRLHLSEPRAGVIPFLLTGRAGMVPSPTAVESAGAGDYGVDGAVGAGPYRYVDMVPAENLRVEAWEGYWQPERQLLAGIEFKGRAGELQVERIRQGEINYAGLRDSDLPAAQQGAAQGVIEYQLDSSTQFAQVFLNFAEEPWDDLRVRQALNHAIDRELLNETLANGAGTVAWSPLPADSWAHDPAVEEMYPYDPDRARELLEEAGHPDGLRVEVAMITRDYYQRMAEAVQDMVEESGFEFELVPVDPSEINNALYVRQEFGAAITANLANADPGLFFESKYGSNGSQNPAGTTADGIDELLAEGAATTDRDQRAESYREAERIIMENALEVPIFHNGALTAYSPRVRGVAKGYTSCDLGNFINPAVYVAQE